MKRFFLQLLCFVPLLWVPFLRSNAELHRALLIVGPPIAFFAFVARDVVREGTFRPGWHGACWIPLVALGVGGIQFLRRWFTGERMVEAVKVSTGVPPNLGMLFIHLLTWVGVFTLLLCVGGARRSDAGGTGTNDPERASLYRPMLLALLVSGTLVSLLMIEQTLGWWTGQPTPASGPHGTFADPVRAGGFLVMLLPLYLIQFMRVRSLLVRGLVATAGAVTSLALFLTNSAVVWGGVLLVAVGIVGGAWARSEQSKPSSEEGDTAGSSVLTVRHALFAAGLLVNGLLLYCVGVPSGRARAHQLLKGPDHGVQRSLLLFRDTLSMVGDHPVIGVAPGNFSAVFSRYRSAQELELSGKGEGAGWMPGPLPGSGSGVLDLMALLGIAGGGAIWGLLLGIPVVRLYRLLRGAGGWRPPDLRRLGWCMAVLVFLFCALFSGGFRSPGAQLVFWILFGLLTIDRAGWRADTAWEPSGYEFAAFGVSGGLGLLLLLLAAGVYLLSGYHARTAEGGRGGLSTEPYEQSIVLFPYRSRVFESYGDDIRRSAPERARQAAQKYRSALRLAPDSYRLTVKLGRTVRRISHGASVSAQKRWDEALNLFQRAVRLHPSLPVAHVERGLTLLSMRKDEAAMEAFRRALKARPDHERARLNLVRLLARNGQRNSLIEQLDRLRRQGFRRWRLLRRWPAFRAYRDDPEVWGRLSRE